jgi:tripartite-type tricarboxylate transporter receptor subunit TctC
MTFSELGNIVEYVRANKLRALGVASEKRNPSLPDVPTMAETLPGFYSTSWSALVAPPNTPAAVVQRIYAALAQSFVKSEAVQKMMAAGQFEAVVSTPQGLVEQIASERERWGKVIRVNNIKQQ